MDVTFSKLRKKGWLDEVAGLLLLLFTAITIGALASYNSADPTWFQSQPVMHRAANWTGRVGATLAELLLQLLGTAAFLVPVVLAVTGWNRFRGKSVASSYGWLIGLLALIASLATLLDLLYVSIGYGGGVLPPGGLVRAQVRRAWPVPGDPRRGPRLPAAPPPPADRLAPPLSLPAHPPPAAH